MDCISPLTLHPARKLPATAKMMRGERDGGKWNGLDLYFTFSQRRLRIEMQVGRGYSWGVLIARWEMKFFGWLAGCFERERNGRGRNEEQLKV